MELTGLTMTQVLTTLGVVGGGVVVLYLLKLRRRVVEVPFVKLWEQVLAEQQTTRLFSQLKRWLSLLLALLVVAALSFALGDPRYAGATAGGRTVVVLVDASASMAGTDVSPSRFERAKVEVTRLIEELGPADRMLVAQLDADARPVGPMSAEPRVLLDALDRVSRVDVAADLGAGLRLAVDVLRDAPRPEVVVVSDGQTQAPADMATRLADEDIRLSWVRVGEGGPNVGVSAFAVRRYPLDKSQSEVLVELWNPGEEDLAVELTLLGDGEPVEVSRLTVRAGERLRRFFRNVSGVDSTLEARTRLLDGRADVLPADDHAYARLPQRRRARVLAVTRGNLYLSAALLLDEYLDVVEITPADYPAEERFDVVVFDDWVPPTPPDISAIYLHPVPGPGVVGPLEVTGTLEEPYFDRIDRRHPLLRWTALDDVNVGEAATVRTAREDRVLAADRSGAPLLVTGTREGARFVAFTFDTRQSDLPLRVAWPLLLLNTIDWFVQEDAGYVSSYRTGDTWHVPVPAGLTEARITDPEGRVHVAPVVEGRAVLSGRRAGFYQLETETGPEVFAANVGAAEESLVTPPEQLAVGDRIAGEPTRGEVGVRQEIWIYLVLGVLLLLTLEWLTYHRRWTV